jgi:hypothetical protein
MKKQKYKYWENTLQQRFVKWLWDRFGVSDRMYLQAEVMNSRISMAVLKSRIESAETELEKEKIKHPDFGITQEEIEKIEHQRVRAYLWRTQHRFWKKEDTQNIDSR